VGWLPTLKGLIMQQTFKNNVNTLYLVSTPIGNLEDITFRAINILKEVSLIYAEDTRTSSILLKHYSINTPLKSYFEHNKMSKIDDVLNSLKDNDIALISDAGMPGISDPGLELVKAVIDAGFNVTTIPGPSASLTALTSSGLLIQPHLFIGFLPRKKGKAIEVLTNYQKLETTLIIYESPHRVGDTLKLLYEVYGNRDVVLARELTKVFETFIRTDLKTAITMDHINKGEYVIMVSGNIDQSSNYSIKELYDLYINEMSDEKLVLKRIARELKIPKSDVYKEIKIDK